MPLFNRLAGDIGGYGGECGEKGCNFEVDYVDRMASYHCFFREASYCFDGSWGSLFEGYAVDLVGFRHVYVSLFGFFSRFLPRPSIFYGGL